MRLEEEINNRILVLDGAMGSMLQRGFTPEEVLSSYVAAGADIITTDSFNANRLVQGDAAYANALNAARTARKVADSAQRKIYVAGSIGPTSYSLTMPSDAGNASFRKYDFDTVKEAYEEQISALKEGGADVLLLETCFDALNAKAAISALAELGNPLPIIISGTVSEASGRTLTGQTLEAFYHSVEHAKGLCAFGLNCSLGAEKMAPLLKEIASFSHHPTVFYPNAGIPDEYGRYNDSPERMAKIIGSLADEGLLNIAGGCCGTTDAHIKAISDAVSGNKPRIIHKDEGKLHVSGMDSVLIDPSVNFTNIGERTNVAGSRKFAKLIAAGDYESAAAVASAQIEGGASIIDVNMDDPMLDSAASMRDFLRYVSSDPATARAAVMIDSSHWGTVLEGLKNCQGKCIVNSISLRDGEQEFIRKARIIRQLGAAMVVMAFDEEGQATTYRRKIEICERSFKLLTQKAGVPPQEIIFDCNILTIGTGIQEHSRFGVDFIEAVRWIKNNLPGAKTSGGVSNLSFAFRGNNAVREAMHSIFLYHAIAAGLDMAILNPQMLKVYDEIEPELKSCIEDVLFDRYPDATAKLVGKASEMSEEVCNENIRKEIIPGTAAERLEAALVKGGSGTLADDAVTCMGEFGSAVSVIEGPLMRGMERVGKLFAEGKMFLPQVVKSAKVMRDAVSVLQPYMQTASASSARPKFLIATVQGDVHDIGKNITSIILQCAGFDVTDMGVMIPADKLLDKAEEIGADIIGVSGLITPSLRRMEEICEQMSSRKMTTPLFVGGAAASARHTAVKLKPLYTDTFYCRDASATAVMAKKFLGDPQAFRKSEQTSVEEILPADVNLTDSKFEDCHLHSIFQDIPLTSCTASELLPYFDWKMFAVICGIREDIPSELKKEALALMERSDSAVKAIARFFDCHREGDDMVCDEFRLPMLRGGYCLADFLPASGSSQMGIFAVNAGETPEDIVGHAVKVCLAEAAAEHMRTLWKTMIPGNFRLITPGIGYPSCPDHSIKRDILELLGPDIGIELTDSCSMMPEASICGIVIAHPEAEYGNIRKIGSDELVTYAGKRGMNKEEQELFLGHLI